jgi:hypothetical protein
VCECESSRKEEEADGAAADEAAALSVMTRTGESSARSGDAGAPALPGVTTAAAAAAPAGCEEGESASPRMYGCSSASLAVMR